MLIVLYYLLICFVALAALFIFLTPHTHYAAFGLLVVILGIAMLYFLQGAAFLATAQIIVYVGGTLLLLLLSAMLVPLSSSVASRPPQWRYLLFTIGTTSSLVYYIIYFVVQTPSQTLPTQSAAAYSVASLGLQFMGPYAWAFEWTGLVLLITLVGAVYIASSQIK